MIKEPEAGETAVDLSRCYEAACHGPAASFGKQERQVGEVAGRADVRQRKVARHQFKMVMPVAKRNAVLRGCQAHGVASGGRAICCKLIDQRCGIPPQS